MSLQSFLDKGMQLFDKGLNHTSNKIQSLKTTVGNAIDIDTKLIETKEWILKNLDEGIYFVAFWCGITLFVLSVTILFFGWLRKRDVFGIAIGVIVGCTTLLFLEYGRWIFEIHLAAPVTLAVLMLSAVTQLILIVQGTSDGSGQETLKEIRELKKEIAEIKKLLKGQ